MFDDDIDEASRHDKHPHGAVAHFGRTFGVANYQTVYHDGNARASYLGNRDSCVTRTPGKCNLARNCHWRIFPQITDDVGREHMPLG